MDPALNPYSPGAGRRPTALVGRDRQLSDWEVRLRRIETGRDAAPAAFFGLRGVGKTVLLTELSRFARDRRWIVAQIEAGSGKTFREALGEALHDPLADMARPSAGKRVLRAIKTALSFKASYDSTGSWNFGLDLSELGAGGADTGVLETDVTRLVRDVGAATDGHGLAILIDEAQDLSKDEMKVVAAVAHRVSQESWPVVFAIAGMPSLPRLLAEAKTYTERLFPFDSIESLPDPVAREALVEPASAEGVSWDDEAVDHVIKASGGYPYFLQEFGQAAWNAASSNTITVSDARTGIAAGRNHLDNGFYRTRWERATKSEQLYLRAMAEDGDADSQTGDIAERLNRKVASLGPTRAKLIEKGIIYAPSHGVVAFTVPGMADFIMRQIVA